MHSLAHRRRRVLRPRHLQRYWIEPKPQFVAERLSTISASIHEYELEYQYECARPAMPLRCVTICTVYLATHCLSGARPSQSSCAHGPAPLHLLCHPLTQAPITCMQIIHQETTRKAAASRAVEFASSSGFAPMSSVGAGLYCGKLRWRWRPMTAGTQHPGYPWRQRQRHPPRPSVTRVLLHVY